MTPKTNPGALPTGRYAATHYSLLATPYSLPLPPLAVYYFGHKHTWRTMVMLNELEKA
jgi:hypothetical protein